jgi:hypothetical protein
MLRGLGQLALPNQFYMAWDEIVHVYSKAKLTVSSDKMIAIAGLADRMKDDFERQLSLRSGKHSCRNSYCGT